MLRCPPFERMIACCFEPRGVGDVKMKQRNSHILFLAIAVGVLLASSCRAPEDDTQASSANSNTAATTAPPAASQDPAPVVGQLATEPPPPPKQVAAPVSAPAPALNGPPPKLVVPTKRIDFGLQPQNRSVTKAFTIRNDGEGELQISAVQPSCGCTTVDFPKSVKARKTGKITLKVETGASPGEHTKTVTILSNDPAQPSVVVNLVLNVK